MLGTAVFVLSALLGTTSTATAINLYSSYGYYSTAGNNYKNQSIIRTDHYSNHAVHVATSSIYRDGGNIGAGWMGALPRRFDGNGILRCVGTWYYNSGPASSISVNGCYINIHSSHLADGQTRAWHGSGYYIYGAFPTGIAFS